MVKDHHAKMSSPTDITVVHRLNYTRYARFIFSIGPSIMVQAFKWLYVGESTSLKEYYDKYPSKFPNLSVSDKKTLQDGREIEQMDVSLLYKLLQRVCGLADPNNPLWYKKPDPGKEKPLEFAIRELKHIRNDISHPHPTEFLNISDNKLNDYMIDLQSLFEEVLVLAAKKGQISDSNLSEAVRKMKEDIRRERYSEESVTDQEFLKICREELKYRSSDWPTISKYVMPRFEEDSTVEKDANLIQEHCTSKPEKSNEISLCNLLKCKTRSKTEPRVFVINGEVGAGKTTLCRFLSRIWLEDSSLVCNLTQYDLVLPLQCSDIHTRDLQYLLRSNVTPNSAANFDVVELTKFLRERKVLWILDGWDEATKEATGVIAHLAKNLEDQFLFHTLLITSRPQVTETLRSILNEDMMLSVSFIGFSEEESYALFASKTTDKPVPDSTEWSIILEKHLVEELKNPLKLELMYKVWQENPDKLKPRQTFTQLYITLRDALIKRLLQKLRTEFSPAENIAERRITNWLKSLYKIAFEAVLHNRGLIISDSNTEILEKSFDPIITSHCLSTFLEYRFPEEEQLDKKQYAFFHATQQFVYASLHIINILSETLCPEIELDKLFQLEIRKFEIETAVDPVLGFYDILYQQWSLTKILFSRITNGNLWPHMQHKSLYFAVKQNLKKSLDLFTNIYTDQQLNIPFRGHWYPVLVGALEIQASERSCSTLPMRSFAKLIHLSLEEHSGTPAYWFEVIRLCEYNEELLQEVIHYIDTSQWIVEDSHLKAAWEILSYVLPERISIHISGAPERLPDLDVLLFMISKQKVEVQVILSEHKRKLCSSDLSNKYLEIVCERTSKCKLTAFVGHLNNRCLLTLSYAKKLEYLNLRTMDGSLVKQLHLVVNELRYLKLIQLILDMKSFPVPKRPLYEVSSSRDPNSSKNPIVNLTLPYMFETNIKKTCNFIGCFCKNYHVLDVGYLDDERLNRLHSLIGGKFTASFIKHRKNLKWRFEFTLPPPGQSLTISLPVVI